MKRKKSLCKFAPSVVKCSSIMCLTSTINSNNYCVILLLAQSFHFVNIQLESPVFDCFVYIRQDATQSYLDVLFYSISVFYELQECSLMRFPRFNWTHFNTLVAADTFTLIDLRIFKAFFILHHRDSFFRANRIACRTSTAIRFAFVQNRALPIYF